MAMIVAQYRKAWNRWAAICALTIAKKSAAAQADFGNAQAVMTKTVPLTTNRGPPSRR